MVVDVLMVALAGMIVGYLGGYTGIGGAPFLIVFLTMVLGMSQLMAQGTVLAVMLGPMSLPAAIVLRRRFQVLRHFIVTGVVSYSLATYFGARLAFMIPEVSLRFWFGVLLVVIGVLSVWSAWRKTDEEVVEPNLEGFTIRGVARFPANMLAVSVVSFITGCVGGLFGIGAGVLMLPIFISVLHIDKDDARAMSLAILLPPSTIGAVLKYQELGYIDWRIAGVLFVAYLGTNYFGAKAGMRTNARLFGALLGVVILVLGLLNIIR
jgi:uncharacterized membrane protein YfcA